MRLKSETEMLYVRSMGKLLKVTAIFTSVQEANEYMAKNRDEGCVAEFGNFVLIASLYDHGIRVMHDNAKAA